MDAAPLPTYSERLANRLRLRWGSPADWSEPRTYRDALHRLREWHSLLDRGDPEPRWRCCRFWQRTLLNKWNGREFAARHGVPLPALYWRGRAFGRLPLKRLPRRFVIRRVRGSSRRGVYVVSDGTEILRGTPATPAQLRRWLWHPREMGLSLPILIEELIRPPDEGRRLPLEFKCHVFGDEVAAIQVVERVDIHKEETKHRYYTPRWETFPDPMSYSLPLADVIQPPPRLDELAELATRLGVALGTYMRVDFFLSDRGWVFNEFSSIPAGGERMTPYCDELFGALWAEKFAHAT